MKFLKAIYVQVDRSLTGLSNSLDKFKYFSAEWIAIFRKYPVYKDIKWTRQQQEEFDAYWKKYYGKKISNRWHRLYEASSGVHRIDYFPEHLYSIRLESVWNDRCYRSVFADKAMNDTLFDGRIEGVRTPKTILIKSYGVCYDGRQRVISETNARELLRDAGSVVIKPTVDSGSGKNVALVQMENGINVKNGMSTEEVLNQYQDNFIVQEKIVPNSQLSTLYPDAINTFRVCSYICGDDIFVAPVSLRMGTGGSEVDNVHAGGITIHVNKNGTLAKYAYRLGYGDSTEHFAQHPDTGVKFEGYQLDCYDRLISAARSLHGMIRNIGMVSWDFTVDEAGNIVLIEANYEGQSVWFPQMISGLPFFGEHTPEILNLLRR